MATFDEIVTVHHIRQVELTTWIQQRWVRPRETERGFEFDEVDEARIALIVELRQDFMVNDDALGVVLSLLDQLYAARRMLRSVEEAVEALPEPMQREIRTRIKRSE
jgi:chaperone modulatory protein CbpM